MTDRKHGEQDPRPLTDVLKTLETSVRARAQPITVKQPSEFLNVKKRKEWIDKWLALDLSNPKVSKAAEQVYEFCRGYGLCPADGTRLFIYGPNGTGKSHIAKAVARWAKRMSSASMLPLISDDRGPRLAEYGYVFWPRFCRDEKDRMHTSEPSYWFEQMCDIDFLILDDVGAEHDPSRWAVEQFYMILDIRCGKWTMITSNIEPESWESRFEKRIASRLVRNCELCDLQGVPDYNEPK